MRNVLKSSELPHAWAHQTQPSARCAANMSFEGPVIRSYGTAIARHIVNKRGEKAVLFNDTRYSNSTATHASRIRGALPPGVPVFWIGNQARGASLQDCEGSASFDYAMQQAAEARAKHDAARTDGNRVFYLGSECGWMKNAAAVAKFYGLRRKVDEKAIERLAAAEVRAKAADAKARRAAEKARDAKMAEDVALWMAGENVSAYGFSRVLLRAEGAEVVTSRGARVPLEDAARTFRFAIVARERGWHRNGEVHKVGPYQLDAVNEAGVVAGCHRIDWTEIERFGKTMAWA